MAATTYSRESLPDAAPELPAAEPERQHEEGKKQDEPRPMSRRTRIIIGVVACVLALAGLGYYVYSRGYEDTDDAEVDGNLSSISARVSATVLEVHVEDNQKVDAGQALVTLDPRDLDVAVAQAR